MNQYWMNYIKLKGNKTLFNWRLTCNIFVKYFHSLKKFPCKPYMINSYLLYCNPEGSELLYIFQKQSRQSWISSQPVPCDVEDTKNEEKVWCVHPKSNSIIHHKKMLNIFHLYANISNFAKSNAWLLFFSLMYFLLKT